MGWNFLWAKRRQPKRAASKSTRAARRALDKLALDKLLKVVICLTHKPICTIVPIPRVAAR